MESEIFGYNRGAFTGATHTSMGKLEIADKGVVFLDDIDSLDVSMQAKLLRIIQEKEFERLGSNKLVKADLRFVAASNKDLKRLIAEGKFREDLYYRLNVFPIELPPLRKRRGDIPLLLQHFLDMFTKDTGKPPKKFSARAIKMFQQYDWPGNIRELKNLVERLFTIIQGPVIRVKDLSFLTIDKAEVIDDLPLKEAVKAFEKRYIAQVLERVNGNRKKAAERLGIHRNTLLSKTNELGLNLKQHEK
jgi:transcriptional regulator with PAS, ATPase and Fis domain